MENTFVIDFETTGLNPYHDEIIEIGLKVFDQDKLYTKLTKPTRRTKLHEKVVQITKITDKMLDNNGIDIYTAFNEMVNFIIENIKDGPIYLMAHNGTMFDFILLQNLFMNVNKVNKLSDNVINIFNRFRYIDTLLLSRKVIRDRYSYSQNALSKMFHIIPESEHRAFGDVIVLETIFKNVVKIYSEYSQIDFKEALNIEYIYNYLYSTNF